MPGHNPEIDAHDSCLLRRCSPMGPGERLTARRWALRLDEGEHGYLSTRRRRSRRMTGQPAPRDQLVGAAPHWAVRAARSTSDRPVGHSGRSGCVPGVEGLDSCRIPASRWPRIFFRSFSEAMFQPPANSSILRSWTSCPEHTHPQASFKAFKLFRRTFQPFSDSTEAPIDVLEWEDWMAGVDNVAGLAKIHLQREGQQHDFRVIFLVSVTEDDGRHRISRIESFYSDQAAFDRFFSVEP